MIVGAMRAMKPRAGNNVFTVVKRLSSGELANLMLKALKKERRGPAPAGHAMKYNSLFARRVVHRHAHQSSKRRAPLRKRPQDRYNLKIDHIIIIQKSRFPESCRLEKTG